MVTLVFINADFEQILTEPVVRGVVNGLEICFTRF